MVDLNWDRSFALEQAGDEEEVLKELLALFRESSMSDFAKITAGITAGDALAVADAAHSIKGAAASMGLESIRHVCHEIEKAGRAGSLDQAASHIGDLESLLLLANDVQ